MQVVASCVGCMCVSLIVAVGLAITLAMQAAAEGQQHDKLSCDPGSYTLSQGMGRVAWARLLDVRAPAMLYP